MDKTALTLTPEELEAYRAGARARWQKEQAVLAARRERAWALARQAATLLREKYSATRVVVFGSLAHGGHFTPWSDVDIAAWGLAPGVYFEAVAKLLDLGDGVEIGLVAVERCKASLRDAIEREGVEL